MVTMAESVSRNERNANAGIVVGSTRSRFPGRSAGRRCLARGAGIEGVRTRAATMRAGQLGAFHVQGFPQLGEVSRRINRRQARRPGAMRSRPTTSMQFAKLCRCSASRCRLRPRRCRIAEWKADFSPVRITRDTDTLQSLNVRASTLAVKGRVTRRNPLRGRRWHQVARRSRGISQSSKTSRNAQKEFREELKHFVIEGSTWCRNWRSRAARFPTTSREIYVTRDYAHWSSKLPMHRAVQTDGADQ